MKNYHNYVGVLIIALTISACSMGFPEQDEKVAKSYCSCYNDAAKQSVEIQDWYEKNFEELESLKEDKEAADSDDDKDFDPDVDVIIEAEEMLSDYNYAVKVAKVCQDTYTSSKKLEGEDADVNILESVCSGVLYAKEVNAQSRLGALHDAITTLNVDSEVEAPILWGN